MEAKILDGPMRHFDEGDEALAPPSLGSTDIDIPECGRLSLAVLPKEADVVLGRDRPA